MSEAVDMDVHGRVGKWTDVPDDLGEVGQAVWRFLVGSGLPYQEPDAFVMRRYAELHDRREALRSEMGTQYTTKGSMGQTRMSPLYDALKLLEQPAGR
jgi:hypothetical protein